MSRFLRALPAAASLAILPISADAASLTFTGGDPLGDHYDAPGSIDLTGATFVVNDVAGDFFVALSADAANPFSGQFIVEIRPPSVYSLPLSYSPTLFDIDLTETATAIAVGPGTDPLFQGMQPGDEADFCCDLYPMGATGTISVWVTDVSGFIAYDGIDTQTVSVSAVPLPAAAWLFVAAVGALGARVKWKEATNRGR